MKQTLLSCLAFVAALGVHADDLKTGYSSVVLRTHEGATTTVTLSDAMTTTFTDDDIIFADATTSVALPLADLRGYTFVEAVIPEGIASPTIAFGGNGVEVFGADGRRVTTLPAATDATEASLRLNTLKPGTYIVRSGKNSMKINIQ